MTVLRRYGRRKSLIAYYAVAGITLILSQVIPGHAGNVHKSTYALYLVRPPWVADAILIA